MGWCEQTVDTNGDGKITQAVERHSARSRTWRLCTTPTRRRRDSPSGARPGCRRQVAAAEATAPSAPFDPKLDTMVRFSLYSTMPSPVDDSVWGVAEDYPGYLVRLQRGNNPPSSCKTQIFKVPAPGYDPRGIDVDSHGVVWTGLAATSDLASFDVRKCKDLTGPQKVDGSQCKEGWTLYQTPGPKLKGTDVPADFHYFNWTDSHNIMQLGQDTPFLTGSNSDSLIALESGDQEVDLLHHPVSARLLRARHGRAHRRCQRRLEGPRAVLQLRHALRLADRRRQGHQGQDREVPDPAGSARALGKSQQYQIARTGISPGAGDFIFRPGFRPSRSLIIGHIL